MRCQTRTRERKKKKHGSPQGRISQKVLAQSQAQICDFVSNYCNILLSPWAQPLWISQKVSALAEPLAQMLRLVGSGLKFCKQRLKYGCHNSFSTSKFEMSENKVQMYKTTS